MSEPPRYSIVIEWSDEDRAYIVSLPEWGDLVHMHGETHEEALRRGTEVIALLVTARRERGESLPAPRVFAASPH